MAISAVAGDTAVTLGWSTVSSATSYNIYRSDTPGGSRTKIASGLSSTSYRNTGRNNGTPYYYVVTAVNTEGESTPSSEVSATPDAVSGPITISGTVLYQDKEYGSNGFTGNRPFKAVRYASIELVDASNSTVTATTQTDSSGLYSISTSTTSANVYVRVKAQATLTGSTPQIEIKSPSGSIYAVGSNDFIPSGPANVSIAVPTASIGGALNILDVFTNGFQFVYSLVQSYPPSLSGYWQTGNINGTYYCSVGCSEGIYILSDSSSGDTDEYDDDVLYHEFGHFTAAHFSQDDSPGGMHTLTDNDLDMRLAWSEGWGDSMPGNIKMWLSANAPKLLSSAATVPLTEYVDTVGSIAGVAIDMDNPDGPFRSYHYACGEVAIAKILLDISKDFGMQHIWDVFTNFLANHPTPVNLELFWDQWHSLGKPTTSSSSVTIDSIFLNRLIQYAPDTYETDGTVPPPSTSTYTFGQPQVHTLYGAGDIDFIAFTGQPGRQYTITTSNLLNGADTVITLLNSDGTTMPGTTPPNPNDNANVTTYSGTSALPSVPSDVYFSTLCDAYGVCHDNGFDILGSKLIFTAASTSTYYVKVQSSSTSPVSAGRYGTYTLTITSP
jgi:hypothetical protein